MSEKHPVYRTPEDRKMFESSYLKVPEAYERAEKVLRENEIGLEMFAGLYDEDVLKRDAAEVQRLEGLFEKTPSKIFADILEAIVCEYGELSDWFGPQSQIIKTSRFDDYINKIDMVVETEREEGLSHLALGIDVTFGSQDLHKKFDEIRGRIDSGELGEVKYFHSDRQHMTGRLRKIPQVVVGVEIEKVKELALLWMNRKNKELYEHPVQVTILEEAVLQLKTFAEYARNNAKKESRDIVVSLLEKETQKIQELLNEKKKNGIRGIRGDKVFEEIKRNLLSFNVPETANG